MVYLMIGTAAVVDPYYVVIFLVLLAAISLAMLYMRIKTWGVDFTPASLISSLGSSELKNASLGKRLSLLASVSFRDIFLLRRAGAWCEEDIHTLGRGLLMWGFSLLVLFSVIGFIVNPTFSHFYLENLLVYLLAGSKLLMIAGALILLLRRLLHKNRRISTDIHTWVLQTFFLLIGLSGFAADLFSLGNDLLAFGFFYLLYLGLFAAFFLYYPFSELAFLVWKGSLLTQESLVKELRRISTEKSEPLAGKR
jgi:hypothetical protein